MFIDRHDAGNQLAAHLEKYRNAERLLVVALPRGGLEVAEPIAKYLNAKLDVVVARKIGAPGGPEFAIGAVTQAGQTILEVDTIRALNISKDYLDKQIIKETSEAQRRIGLYRENKPPADFKEKIIVLVDDGLATGATMKAAIKYLRSRKIGRLVAAVPVAPVETADQIRGLVEELIVLEEYQIFEAVGSYYENFGQVSDQTVVKIIKKI